MNTKETVLSCLEENRGEYRSGGELAEKLGVSRNAVWKAIRQLQAEGHEIDTAHGRGYRLSQNSSVISRQSIGKYLKTTGVSIAVYEELPSTNLAVRQLAEQGAPEGTVILARRQTSGRGRLGRSFYSPADSGIYMSILLRPGLAAQEALLITTCAAVAVAQAIEKHTGSTCGIKWVNDIFCADRKVCGILTEASLDLESGGLHYAVLGIGMNVFPPKDGFPEDIRGIAGCVSAEQTEDLNSRIAAEVIDRFFAEYPRISEKAFLDEYCSRSILTGKKVNVMRVGAEPRPAEVLGIGEDLSLLLRYADGTEEPLATGEVSVRLDQ